MGRETNWRLRGWKEKEVLNEYGRKVKKLIYCGEYYAQALSKKGRNLVKVTDCLLTVLCIGAYVWASLAGSPGCGRLWIGSCILCIIPMIYMVMGTASIAVSGERLTYRSYRGGFLRVRWTSIAVALLTMVALLGEVFYIIGLVSVPMGDIIWLAGIAVSFAAALALVVLCLRYPPRLIPPELR